MLEEFGPELRQLSEPYLNPCFFSSAKRGMDSESNLVRTVIARAEDDPFSGLENQQKRANVEK